ncbi:hypothetical protein WMF18_10125 [Sorangium sp. So ce315]|uniref:hypothetical protein n=1 Tax=Sorangium sp. So ce315 TaxID=3133299 RepID=UPI003F61D23E
MERARVFWFVDPDDPRAPPQETWDQMTPEERQQEAEQRLDEAEKRLEEAEQRLDEERQRADEAERRLAEVLAELERHRRERG